MRNYYTVAVQYDDATDILDAMYYDVADALELRDKLVEDQKTEPWAGLRYVYVVVNGRRMV
jgi:hypothetical protein